MERAALNRDGVSRAEKAEAGSIVCIDETHEDEQAHPWVIGEVTKTIHEAPAASRRPTSQPRTRFTLSL